MRLLCLSAVLLLLLFAGPLSSEAQTFSEQRSAAAMAIASKHYQEALSALTPLITAHPADATLWTLNGLALAGLNKLPDAFQSFDRALQIDPNFIPALQGSLQTAYNRGDPQGPEFAKRLLALQPANPVANAMAGVMAYQAHDCTGAQNYFEVASGSITANDVAVAEFADCLMRDGKTSRAVEILSQAVAFHPDSVRGRYNAAYAQMKNHEAKAAIAMLEPVAGEQDPGLLNLLASAYAQADRPDDALQALQRAITLAPQDPTNYLDFAILCLEHHQETRAAAAATAGIARIPKAASLFLIRGVAYAELAQYDKAEVDFSSASQADPQKPHGTIAMSLLYSDRNDLDKEKALLTKQLESTPDDAVSNYLLAELLVRNGAAPGSAAFTEAQQRLSTSLKANPESAEAQILMGKLCEQVDQANEAHLHFQAALRIEPDNKSALDHDFLLLRRLRRNDEAKIVAQHLKEVINQQFAHDNGTLRSAAQEHEQESSGSEPAR